jgi:general secretion pathway protein A
MYEQFYGLREKPFSLTPDPEFVFLGQGFRTALDQLLYGIQRREGFMAVVGDVGTGKTMLCWTLLSKLDRRVRTALILHPFLNQDEILKAILHDFGVLPRGILTPPAVAEEARPSLYDPSWMEGLTRKELVDELNAFLLEAASENAANLLVIDEAQNLSPAALEFLRVLSNMETPKQKLLQIIFVGQVEFEQKLNMPQLRQLNQRVTVRCRLGPMNRDDATRYILHRLVVAGGTRKVSFSAGGLKSIHRFSGGYPRLINIICDRALLAGYSERSRVITRKMVRKAALALRGKDMAAPGARWRIGPRWAIPVLAAALIVLVALILFLASGNLFVRLFGGTGSAHRRLPTAQAADRAEIAVTRARATPASPPPTIMSAGQGGHAAQPVPDDPPPSPSPPGGDSYLLQVHSFEARQRAVAAVAELQGKGYPAVRRLVQGRDSVQWHVVYVGPFRDIEEAQVAARALKEHENLPSILRELALSRN